MVLLDASIVICLSDFDTVRAAPPAIFANTPADAPTCTTTLVVDDDPLAEVTTNWIVYDVDVSSEYADNLNTFGSNDDDDNDRRVTSL